MKVIVIWFSRIFLYYCSRLFLCVELIKWFSRICLYMKVIVVIGIEFPSSQGKSAINYHFPRIIAVLLSEASLSLCIKFCTTDSLIPSYILLIDCTRVYGKFP